MAKAFLIRGGVDVLKGSLEVLREHTYATFLLARGVHPTYAQRALGHSTVAMTLDRYSHWMPSMGRATAEAIDAALG